MSERQRPQRYGRCLIEREIGHGARSTVYLAWHEGLQIPVAVKVMRKEAAPDDELFSERFLREARIAAQLTHPNIVRVYDCGETEDAYYLVLEYIEGESCKDRMSRGAGFDWQSAVRIIREVADGLNYAAKKGIIHRDLKPENIMIDKEGHVRIADLGLAKQVGVGRGSATADGDVLGTPYYMSPEQVRQPGEVDFRSDIYSLGATLYHMVTGEVPFEAATPFEIMTMHLTEPLVPPQERRHDLPEALSDVVVRTMAKEPQNRYQSYADLLRDLDGLMSAAAHAPDVYMAAVEETLDQSPPEPELAVHRATAAAAEEQSAEPLARSEHQAPEPEEGPAPIVPIARNQLPVTQHSVRAKVMGVVAAFAYALFIACIYYLLGGLIKPFVGALAVMAFAAFALFWAVRVARPGAGAQAELPHSVDEQFSAALSYVCERLDLPTPYVHISPRRDEQTLAYSLFTRKAAVDIPGGWLQEAGLSDEQMKAFAAQSLAGLYNGDSDIRTLLSVPVAILNAGRRGFKRLVELPRGLSARARFRLSQGTAAFGIVMLCVLIAGLFRASFLAGVSGLLFVGLLLLVAAFERHSLQAGDPFAAKVVENLGAVKSLIAVSGLAGPEQYHLLMECMGPGLALKGPDGPLSPEERQELIENIAAHYSAAAHVPNTLETARRLFSAQPSAADRLNRLALLPERRPAVVAAMALARRAYGRLVGLKSEGRTSMAELAGVRTYVLIGAVGGAFAVFAVLFLYLRRNAEYPALLAANAALGAALGLAVACRNRVEGITVGRLGWATIVAAVTFGITMMLGLCLTEWAGTDMLAMEFPVFFVIVLLMSLVTGALFVRWGPKSPRSARFAPRSSRALASNKVAALDREGSTGADALSRTPAANAGADRDRERVFEKQ